MAKTCGTGEHIDWKGIIPVRHYDNSEPLRTGERLAELGPEDEGMFAWGFFGFEIVLLIPGDKVVIREAGEDGVTDHQGLLVPCQAATKLPMAPKTSQ